MSALMCSRCRATAMPKRVQGLLVDPAGWSWVTLTLRPIMNRTLCPGCTDDVRALLGTPPDVLERQREVALEGAFSRGYDEGCVDTLRSTQRAGEVSA